MDHAAYMRGWRAKHPEYREYMRQWRAANAERLAAYRRQRYEANHEREIDLCVIWQNDHPVEAAIHRKVAAANKYYPGRITAQDVRDVIARVGWICCWCKEPIRRLRDFTLEHLEPRNDPACLSIACHSCNCAKLPSAGLSKRLTLDERKARIQQRSVSPEKRAYDQRYKREHKDQENAAQRARYHANLDARRAYFREWQRKKRESLKLA